MLKISHLDENTELLGPFKRFVIWVHGCCFDCEGCMALNTRYGDYEEISEINLAEKIIKSDTEGITISGGEPFLQAEALANLIHEVKKNRDIGVILYSGFTLEELKVRSEFEDLLSCSDILIDGKYIKELDNGRAYIGSSNQRLHFITERYKGIAPEYYSSYKRKAEIKIKQGKIFLIGVPSRETLEIWQKLKEKFVCYSQSI